MRVCAACGYEQLALSPVAVYEAECGACGECASSMTGTSHPARLWPELVIEVQWQRAVEAMAPKVES